MDCSLPSSSVHGIFQARVLEWGAITFSIRSTNQGKLEVVKQEMARVNILGIRELKWTGMGNLTQMTIVSTTVSRNPLEEME